MGTETLICGTDGVEVRVSVAVNVCDGVWVGVWVRVWVSVSVSVFVGINVGGSDENVGVGSGFVGDKNSNKAEWVSPAITVSAAAVLIAPGSCMEKAGIAQARTTIDNAIIAREIRLDLDMAPPEKKRIKRCFINLDWKFG